MRIFTKKPIYFLVKLGSTPEEDEVVDEYDNLDDAYADMNKINPNFGPFDNIKYEIVDLNDNVIEQF